MKPNRSTDQRKVMLGSVLGLCILGGAFGWHKWQTRRGEWAMPVYTRIQTAQGLVYQEIPLSEYKKSWKEMALATPNRYTKLDRPIGGEEYVKLFVPEALGHETKASQFRVQHNFPAAIAEMRKAVAADPNNPSLQWELGMTLQRGGQTEEASEVLTPLTQEPGITGRLATKWLERIRQDSSYAQPKR